MIPNSGGVTVLRIHDDVHVIADEVTIPIGNAERTDVDKAFKLIERLRRQCIKAAEVDMSLVEDEKVVIAFDFKLNGSAIVTVTQVSTD
jgi:hypothetical protein